MQIYVLTVRNCLSSKEERLYSASLPALLLQFEKALQVLADDPGDRLLEQVIQAGHTTSRLLIYRKNLRSAVAELTDTLPGFWAEESPKTFEDAAYLLKALTSWLCVRDYPLFVFGIEWVTLLTADDAETLKAEWLVDNPPKPTTPPDTTEETATCA